MKKLSIIILQCIMGAVTLIVLTVSVFLLHQFAGVVAELAPNYAFWQYPILVGLYMAALSLLFGIYYVFKLLWYISKNQQFSESAVDTLKKIKICAMKVAVLYVLSVMPVVYLVAEAADGPGLILIVLFFDAIPVAVAAGANLLQHIFASASNKN